MKTWRIEFESGVEKDLKKLDRSVQGRIMGYLYKKVAPSADPRQHGKPLTGGLSGLWRYRVGDYRIVCRIEKERLVVLVISIGHRKSVYE